MKKYLSIILLSSVALFACKSETKKTENTETPPPSMVEQTKGPTIVTVNADDAMKYDVSEIKAKSGENVEITLNNVGKLPKASMGHNLVVLKSDADVEKFATAAIADKANDYIPASMADQIIAHTKLLGPGESDKISFTAPAPGTYNFLCSFPGHHASMKGVLIVE